MSIGPDNVEIVVAAHDAEIQLLRQLHDLHSEMLDALQIAVDALRQAVEPFPQVVRQVQRTLDLAERHDRTLRAMHQGLHQTSDPGMYPVIEKRTPR